MMPRVKVTRNFQVTIPAEVRAKLGIKEGDLMEVYTDDKGRIVMEKVKKRRKTLKSGRKLTIEEINSIIERGRRETFEGGD